MNKNEEQKTDDRAKEQARAHIDSIVEMINNYRKAEEEDEDMDEARMTIEGDPLSIEVRSGWYTPGAENNKPEEFKILLCWGGPAVRITGNLNDYGQPDRAVVEYQDWYTGWIEYNDTTDEEDEAILNYCRMFYFWEG